MQEPVLDPSKTKRDLKQFRRGRERMGKACCDRDHGPEYDHSLMAPGPAVEANRAELPSATEKAAVEKKPVRPAVQRAARARPPHPTPCRCSRRLRA